MGKSMLRTINKDETPREHLERVNNWAGWQYTNLLDDLPSIEAIFELHHLITVICDMDMIDGLFQGDSVSETEAKHWNRFIDKHKLKSWKLAKATK